MLERVDENTIMVVPTFGVTYTGSYEPVLELSQALDTLQQDTGLDIDIHVDGASGAFLAPFCAPDVEWDFRVPRVKSISTSGREFGLAPLGVGWVLWRDAAELPSDLIFHVTYLGGDMPVFQIAFRGRRARSWRSTTTSCGSAGTFTATSTTLATARATLLHLGGRQARSVRTALRLQCPDRDPDRDVAVREGEDPGYTLYDIADRLRTRGWQVPAYPLTGPSPTSRSSASWCAKASAATWPGSCSRT